MFASLLVKPNCKSSCQTKLCLPVFLSNQTVFASLLIRSNCVFQTIVLSNQTVFAKQSACQTSLYQTVVLSNQSLPNSPLVSYKPVFAKQSVCHTSLFQTVHFLNQTVFAKQSSCQTKLCLPKSPPVKPNCLCLIFALKSSLIEPPSTFQTFFTITPLPGSSFFCRHPVFRTSSGPVVSTLCLTGTLTLTGINSPFLSVMLPVLALSNLH